MIDTMVAFQDRIAGSTILQDMNIRSGEFALITMHRPATVDDKQELDRLLEILQFLASDLSVVYPVHPRTRSNLFKHGLWERLIVIDRLFITEPLDYFAFQKLMASSFFVLTDSGGIQEETTFLGVPCLTLRPNTERPITIDLGTNELVQSLAEIETAVEKIRAGNWKKGKIPELWDGHATERVIEVLRTVL